MLVLRVWNCLESSNVILTDCSPVNPSLGSFRNRFNGSHIFEASSPDPRSGRQHKACGVYPGPRPERFGKPAQWTRSSRARLDCLPDDYPLRLNNRDLRLPGLRQSSTGMNQVCGLSSTVSGHKQLDKDQNSDDCILHKVHLVSKGLTPAARVPAKALNPHTVPKQSSRKCASVRSSNALPFATPAKLTVPTDKPRFY